MYYHNFVFLSALKRSIKSARYCDNESVSRHVPKHYELCNDSHYIFVHNWGELRENNKND